MFERDVRSSACISALLIRLKPRMVTDFPNGHFGVSYTFLSGHFPNDFEHFNWCWSLLYLSLVDQALHLDRQLVLRVNFWKNFDLRDAHFTGKILDLLKTQTKATLTFCRAKLEYLSKF